MTHEELEKAFNLMLEIGITKDLVTEQRRAILICLLLLAQELADA